MIGIENSITDVQELPWTHGDCLECCSRSAYQNMHIRFTVNLDVADCMVVAI